MSDLKTPLSSQSSDEEYALLEGIRADDQRVEEYEEKRDAEDANYQPPTQESIGSLFSSQSSATDYQPSSPQESDSTTSNPFACSQESASSQESDSTTSNYSSCSQESASSQEFDSTTSSYFSGHQGSARFSADEETAGDEHDTESEGPPTPTNIHHGQFSTPRAQRRRASYSSPRKWSPSYKPCNTLKIPKK